MRTRFQRRDVAAAVLITAFAAIAYYATLRPGHDWGGDFSVYIAHARNIVQGRPYLETTYLATPESAVHHPPAYPPVFPLLLAPVYAAFGLHYLALKLVVLACFALSLPFYYGLARLRGGELPDSAMAAMAFGLSGLVLSLKESVVSEGAYSLFAGASLFAAALLYQRGWDRTHPVRAGLAVALLFLLAYGTRAAGLALLAALAIHEAWKSRRVRLFSLVVAGGFLAGIVLCAATVYDFRSYGDQFSVNWQAYRENLAHYFRAPASLWSGASEWFRYPVTLAALLLAGLEMVRRTLREPSVAEWYAWISVAMVLVYTSGRSPRYLAGFFPLFVLYAVEGARWWSSRLGGQWEQAGRSLVIAALAAGIVFNLRAAERGPIREGVEQPTFAALCEFLERNVSPDGVLVSSNPRVIALYTERPSALYPYASDDGTFLRRLKQMGRTYLILFRHVEEDRTRLLPVVGRNGNRFRLVYENPDFLVYALR